MKTWGEALLGKKEHKIQMKRVRQWEKEMKYCKNSVVDIPGFEKTIGQMLEVQKKYHNAKTDRDKEFYKKQIGILDHQIDQLVYKLYDLTDEEIEIVEESL